MSSRVLHRILAYQRRDEAGAVQRIPAAESLVLFVLGVHAQDDGFCRAEVHSLAQEAKLSERQVQRALRTLEQYGEVVVHERRGRSQSNHYLVAVGLSKTQLRRALRQHGWPEAEAQAIVRRLKPLHVLSPEKGDKDVTFFGEEQAPQGKKGDRDVTFFGEEQAPQGKKGDKDVTL